MYEIPPDVLLRRLAETLDGMIAPSLPSTYLRGQATAIATVLRFLSVGFAKQHALLHEDNRATEAVLRLMLETMESREASSAQPQLKSEIGHCLEAGSGANPLERNLHLKGTLVRAIKALEIVRHELSPESLTKLEDRLASQLRVGIRGDLEIYDAVISAKGSRTDTRSNG